MAKTARFLRAKNSIWHRDNVAQLNIILGNGTSDSFLTIKSNRLCGSALSAVLETLLAIHFGINVVVIIALLFYGIAALIMITIPEITHPQPMEIKLAP